MPTAPRKLPRFVIVAAIVLLLLLVLYVLSVGPAAYLVISGRFREETYKTTYGPLHKVCNAVGAGDWFLAYEQWGVNLALDH